MDGVFIPRGMRFLNAKTITQLNRDGVLVPMKHVSFIRCTFEDVVDLMAGLRGFNVYMITDDNIPEIIAACQPGTYLIIDLISPYQKTLDLAPAIAATKAASIYLPRGVLAMDDPRTLYAAYASVYLEALTINVYVENWHKFHTARSLVQLCTPQCSNSRKKRAALM